MASRSPMSPVNTSICWNFSFPDPLATPPPQPPPLFAPGAQNVCFRCSRLRVCRCCMYLPCLSMPSKIIGFRFGCAQQCQTCGGYHALIDGQVHEIHDFKLKVIAARNTALLWLCSTGFGMVVFNGFLGWLCPTTLAVVVYNGSWSGYVQRLLR